MNRVPWRKHVEFKSIITVVLLRDRRHGRVPSDSGIVEEVHKREWEEARLRWDRAARRYDRLWGQHRRTDYRLMNKHSHSLSRSLAHTHTHTTESLTHQTINEEEELWNGEVRANWRNVDSRNRDLSLSFNVWLWFSYVRTFISWWFDHNTLYPVCFWRLAIMTEILHSCLLTRSYLWYLFLHMHSQNS